MSPYLVPLLIFEFFLARLVMLPYGLHSNVTKLLANLLTKLYFIIMHIIQCNLVSIKYIIIIIIIIIISEIEYQH